MAEAESRAVAQGAADVFGAEEEGRTLRVKGGNGFLV